MEEGFIINFADIVGVVVAILAYKFSLKFVKYTEDIKKINQTYSKIKHPEMFKGAE